MSTLSYILLLAHAAKGLSAALIFLSILLATAGIIYIIYMCGGFNSTSSSPEPKGTSKKWPVTCFIVAIIFAIIGALMPDQKTVYMVAGVETINKFSQTEVAKELGESGMSIVRDITTMIHTYTMEAVKDAKKKKKNVEEDDDYKMFIVALEKDPQGYIS